MVLGVSSRPIFKGGSKDETFVVVKRQFQLVECHQYKTRKKNFKNFDFFTAFTLDDSKSSYENFTSILLPSLFANEFVCFRLFFFFAPA